MIPAFGNYPKEYNRTVHGPFYPWINYSNKKDTPLQDVKLGEFKAWFARRDKSPQASIAAISRIYHLWMYKWMNTRYGSGMPAFIHAASLASFASMLMLIPHLKTHRLHKYHW